MIYWAPFLHFYQPPTQFHAILQRVCKESYRPLLEIFAEHTNTKVTINICGVLTETLNQHGGKDIINSMKELGSSGRLEFVESAKYHAILPLIPPKEAQRQIELNHKANEFFFGDAYKPNGFFLPEMCYSDEIASMLAAMGYEWVILSGISCTEDWPLDVIYKIQLEKNSIVTFFRDDIISNKISFQNMTSQNFISELKALSKNKKDIYVITAMDAETFGHHIQHWEELFLEEVYEVIETGKVETKHMHLKQKRDLAEKHKVILDSDLSGKIEVVTMSELLKQFPTKTARLPHASSWSTSKEDIQHGNYYPLWKNKSNPIHMLQWDHMNICFKLVEVAGKMREFNESQRYVEISRSLMDSAVHSCQLWWANKGRMWDINMVNKGLMLQEESAFNAYKAIAIAPCSENIKKKSYQNLVAARDLANKIRDHLLET